MKLDTEPEDGAMEAVPTAREGGHPGLRGALRRLSPYLIGGAMFTIALWVLHSTLARYHLADLHEELAQLTASRLGSAVLFTAMSFLALIGYEYSALTMIGKRLPFRQLSLASFATQSIAHSTGFAFLIGATLRYNFYASRGLKISDVAKVQVFFTITFTLGVASLAGVVVMIEPWRLAAATGLPAWLWRLAAGTALTLVTGYVIWGSFFHRPFHWRGRVFTLPSAGATLTQIFFGVADLLAVAGALYVLLPPELHLTYLEVLTVFMASIVVGLMSHVPGSLGVFESAVILLLQPAEHQILPLIGALLAFRAVYYILPLCCGVFVLALSEMHRWRFVLLRLSERARLDLGPATPQAMATLVFAAGIVLVVAAMVPGSSGVSSALLMKLPQSLAELGEALEVTTGLALLLLGRGLAQQLAVAWRWSLGLSLVGFVACILGGEPVAVDLLLLVVAALLFACRAAFSECPPQRDLWHAPVWVLLLAATLASSFWLIGRG
jgi:uncharacterized membrane protein YbhN (UPF0104 family)